MTCCCRWASWMWSASFLCCSWPHWWSWWPLATSPCRKLLWYPPKPSVSLLFPHFTPTDAHTMQMSKRFCLSHSSFPVSSFSSSVNVPQPPLLLPLPVHHPCSYRPRVCHSVSTAGSFVWAAEEVLHSGGANSLWKGAESIFHAVFPARAPVRPSGSGRGSCHPRMWALEACIVEFSDGLMDHPALEILKGHKTKIGFSAVSPLSSKPTWWCLCHFLSGRFPHIVPADPDSPERDLTALSHSVLRRRLLSWSFYRSATWPPLRRQIHIHLFKYYLLFVLFKVLLYFMLYVNTFFYSQYLFMNLLTRY